MQCKECKEAVIVVDFFVIQIFRVQLKDDRLVLVVKLTCVISKTFNVFLYHACVHYKTGKYCISGARIKFHASAKRDRHIN